MPDGAGGGGLAGCTIERRIMGISLRGGGPSSTRGRFGWVIRMTAPSSTLVRCGRHVPLAGPKLARHAVTVLLGLDGHDDSANALQSLVGVRQSEDGRDERVRLRGLTCAGITQRRPMQLQSSCSHCEDIERDRRLRLSRLHRSNRTWGHGVGVCRSMLHLMLVAHR